MWSAATWRRFVRHRLDDASHPNFNEKSFSLKKGPTPPAHLRQTVVPLPGPSSGARSPEEKRRLVAALHIRDAALS